MAASAMMLPGCKEDIPGPDYPAPQPVTEIGKAIVENTSLIASLSEDVTWTVFPGLEATRLRYLAYDGKPMMMFFFEVDLTRENLTVSQTTPFDLPIGSGAEPVTEQAMHVDAPGFRIWGGTNSDFGSETTSEPQGIFHHEGVCLKGTFNSLPVRPRSFFYLTKDKKAYTAPAADYEAVAASDVIWEACGGGPVIVSEGKTINIVFDLGQGFCEVLITKTDDGCSATGKLIPLAATNVKVTLSSACTIPANPSDTEYVYYITVGTATYPVTGAEGIVWQDGTPPEVEPNSTLVVSVIDNLAVWGTFKEGES